MLENMERKLRTYHTEILARITAGEDSATLRAYHAQRVQEFMHERQMHLYVTLFFGFLVLVFTGTLLLVATLGLVILIWLVAAMALLVAVTEAFYVVHYYQLENGVQSLYEVTEQLYLP